MFIRNIQIDYAAFDNRKEFLKDEKAKVIDMCKAWEDAITEGKIAGRAEGIIEMGKEYNVPKEKIIINLQSKLNISQQQAQEYYEQYSSGVLV